MMWPFAYKCEHVLMYSVFKDFHTGADGELYVRHWTYCRNCDYKKCFAVRLPDSVSSVLVSANNLQLWRLDNAKTN